MKKDTLLKIVSVVIGLLTIPLGPIIWSVSPDAPVPTVVQLMFFIGVSAFEALGFGVGIYFLFTGWELLKKVKDNSLTFWTYIAISWSLISWWPHDHLHEHIGMNLNALLWIEYGFHATLIVSAVIIAKFFYQVMKKK